MASRFSQLLSKAQTFKERTVADSSLSTYNEYIKLYEQTMIKLEADPYDITIEKMMVFIQFEKDEGLELNSLKACIAALSFYFRNNKLPNLKILVNKKFFSQFFLTFLFFYFYSKSRLRNLMWKWKATLKKWVIEKNYNFYI